MKTRIEALVAVTLAVSPLAVLAQADEEETYIYGTYYRCDVTRQEEVDELTRSGFESIYDSGVDEGLITGWGWLSHHTGGPWRRLFYFTAPSIGQLLEAQDALGEQEDEDDRALLGAICNSHDDYIWRRVTGSPADQGRGSVSLSAYYECDQGREAKADEIVRSILGPIYEAQVDAGLLTSWGWNEHIVGGRYRRLATMAATDWDSLFEARDNLTAGAGANELTDEFFSICSSHADYMWDIQIETP